MQFLRYEVARLLNAERLSEAERVHRMSRAGPAPRDVRGRKPKLAGILRMTRSRVAALRAYRAGVLATPTVSGENQQDR